MNEQRSAFVALLDQERQSRGLSWRAVARAAGVDQSAIWRLRHGKPVVDTAIWRLWTWADTPPEPPTVDAMLLEMEGV